MQAWRKVVSTVVLCLIAGKLSADNDTFDVRHQLPIYKHECGACHLAYPAELLPAKSWAQIMMNLHDHFGDNAELDSETAKQIANYLRDNAAAPARKGWGQESRSLRISQSPYFIHEHRELSLDLVGVKGKVKSYSDCKACHTRADKGSFREKEINIPGYGAWHD